MLDPLHSHSKDIIYYGRIAVMILLDWSASFCMLYVGDTVLSTAVLNYAEHILMHFGA